MSTILHYKTVLFALLVNLKAKYGIVLQCQVSEALADNSNDQMGLF